MAARRIIRQILDEEEENLPRIRKFKHLINPFDGLSDVDINNRYRFPANIILEMMDLIKDGIERPSNRSHALPPLIQSFHFLNIQGVCDVAGYFTNLTVMWPGSTHDAGVFNELALCHQLENGEHLGHLLGDSGYGSKIFLLTPYLSPKTPKQVRYNNTHKRTRILIEQVFGQWKRRFTILHGDLRVKYEHALLVIICCSILHNIAVKHRLPDFEEMNEDLDDHEFPNLNVQNLQNGLRYRDMVTHTIFAGVQ
uniref:DDE Tnp4 domain-containing protein n=1 Tax=Romanomermis culicivorax TaxID=13658 RepID=A0A915IQZ8_ROMCU